MSVKSHPGGVLVATSLVNEFGRAYPDVWKFSNAVRTNPGIAGYTWKHWCYLPINVASGILNLIINPDDEYDPLDPAYSAHLSMIGAQLSAYAAWRMTKGVYRFDPELYKELIDTPIEGDIPSEVFFRLPEWCVFIETPGMKFAGMNMPGFFAHIDHRVKPDGKDMGAEIRLLQVIEKPESMKAPGECLYMALPSAVPLGKHTVEEGVRQILAEHAQYKDVSDDELVGAYARDKEKYPELMEDVEKEVIQDFACKLSLLLYLCANEAEIKGAARGAKPGNPKLTKTRKGVKTFPAEKPLAWDVGYRIGPALKLAREQAEKADAAPSTTAGVSSYHVKPHIRRAHWHTFWTGPRDDAAARKPNVKWLQPNAVNMDKPEDLVTTIHPVQPPAAA